jgi:hypothetical protein
MASYLPLSDDGLASWALSFATYINSGIDPTTIGLTLDEATAYQMLQQDYATKLAAAKDPETRGNATIYAKQEAKQSLVSESRRLAMIVTNYPATTNKQRQAMGLTIKDTTPSPVPVPDSAPVVEVREVKNQRITLVLHNAESTSRAKPAGVKGATLFSYVGESTPAALSDWKFEGNVTRTLVDLDMPATVPNGSKVWITAFWFNSKAESGPATAPIYTYLGGGLSQGEQQQAA